MIVTIPWIIISLIFLSAYMAFKAIRAERKLEQQYIEGEGKIYIERMEAEREFKQRKKQHLS